MGMCCGWPSWMRTGNVHRDKAKKLTQVQASGLLVSVRRRATLRLYARAGGWWASCVAILTPQPLEGEFVDARLVAETLEPLDTGFFAEPSELALGVATSGLLDCNAGIV